MRITFQNRDISVPDFLMVGAAKSGTTTIYHYLSQHPEIFFPKKEKEPFYFCFGGEKPRSLDPQIINRVTWNTQDYIKLFEPAETDQVCCDASTSYLYKSETVIPNIQKFYRTNYTRLKVGMILRNPIDRAYSHYTYLVRNGHESLSFEEALQASNISSRKTKRWGFDYLGYSLYSEHVSRYINSFNHCKIFLFEDILNPNKLMNQLFDFLELNPIEVEESKKLNPSGIPKNKTLVTQMRKNKVLKSMVNLLPTSIKHKILEKRDRAMEHLLVKEDMAEETRNNLKEYFREDIALLENIINRDLKHWMT